MLLSKFEIPKKRLDFDSIFHDISRNEFSNIDKDTVQILIPKLIDSNVITVKETKQGQKSLFLAKDATEILTDDNTVSISLNNGSQDATPVDPNDIDLSVSSTKPKDSGNTKPNPTSNHNFVSLELFNTFYDDYIEYKHYVNDVMQNISSNKELGKSFENDTKTQQSKIKLLQQEIQTLKNEKKDLKEENKYHLKIIELLSAGHDTASLKEIMVTIIQHELA